MSITIGEGTIGAGALDDYTQGAANGTDPTAADNTAAQANGLQNQPIPGKGELLEEPDEPRVVRRVKELYQARDNQLKPLVSQWDANELTVQGVPGVRAVYDPQTGAWFARVPNAATERIGPSKSWELITKTTSTLLADPPVPDAEPAHDVDRERNAAELLTQILKVEQGESGLHFEKRAELASNLAGTHGSAFDVFTVDPHGGGWYAMQVKAHPMATQYDDANPDAVTLDPETGEPSQEYVDRYVMPNGALAMSPVGARRAWRMAITVERKTGRQVRFLPLTAEGIEDATGVIIADPISFGELCSLYPAIRDWAPEDQIKLVSWRPVPLSKLLPRALGITGDGKTLAKDGPNAGSPTDEAICVVLKLIFRSHGAYPDGALIVVAGEEFVLHRQTQAVVIGGGDDATEECLILPVAQCVAYSDPKGGNPYGMGEAEFLGPSDEVRQQIMAGILDRLWQLNNRNVFVDLASNIDPHMLTLRDGTPIATDLRAGQPVWEDVPQVEPELMAVYETIGGEMNSRQGLEAAAQGVASPDVKSGIHAQQVVEQALVALTQRKRNLDAFMVRSWRIYAQLLRAYATTSQLLKYPSEDGSFKVREWKNTDLGSTREVRIARGTGTMLTRTAKQNLAQNDLALAISTQDPSTIQQAYARYQRVAIGNLDPLLGIEEDPHRLRVRRQLASYMEGPPEMQEEQNAPPPQPAAGAAQQPADASVVGAISPQLPPAPNALPEAA